MTPLSLTPTRPPCACVGENWCSACADSRAARQGRVTAQRLYYERNRAKRLAYGKRYRATHRPPRRDAEVSPLPATLVAAALSGIPERWREADVLGDGAYLWHCEAWQKIDAIPHVCPDCGIRFFEKENAA